MPTFISRSLILGLLICTTSFGQFEPLQNHPAYFMRFTEEHCRSFTNFRYLPSFDSHVDIFTFLERPFDARQPTLLFVDGGPGGIPLPMAGGLEEKLPTWNILYFHIRGAGCSKFSGQDQELTTKNVARDIEAIRLDYSIDKFALVYGVSYGSLAARVYADLYPDGLAKLLLEGVSYDPPQLIERADEISLRDLQSLRRKISNALDFHVKPRLASGDYQEIEQLLDQLLNAQQDSGLSPGSLFFIKAFDRAFNGELSAQFFPESLRSLSLRYFLSQYQFQDAGRVRVSQDSLSALAIGRELALMIGVELTLTSEESRDIEARHLQKQRIVAPFLFDDFDDLSQYSSRGPVSYYVNMVLSNNDEADALWEHCPNVPTYVVNGSDDQTANLWGARALFRDCLRGPRSFLLAEKFGHHVLDKGECASSLLSAMARNDPGAGSQSIEALTSQACSKYSFRLQHRED